MNVAELLNNHLLTKIQKATPLSKDVLDALVRPETVSGLQERIDAFTSKAEAAAELEGGIDDHLDEDNDANNGAIAAVVVGIIVLFSIITLILYRLYKREKVTASNVASKALVQEGTFNSQQVIN